MDYDYYLDIAAQICAENDRCDIETVAQIIMRYQEIMDSRNYED